MARHRTSPEATPILQLLSDYSFDVEAYGAEAMVTDWLQRFEPVWVSQAITEALYQGRYKVVSVDHILQIWQRRGQPLRHFNREFESIILGQSLGQIPSPAKESPAPLNFSQDSMGRDGLGRNSLGRDSVSQGNTVGQDNTVGRDGNPLTFAELSHPVAVGSEDHAPLGTPLPDQSADPCPAPWLSSRTIPPLTPDQLARLSEPLTPVVSAPIAPAPVEDTPREAVPMASLPDDSASEAQEPAAADPNLEVMDPEAADLGAADPEAVSVSDASLPGESPSEPLTQVETTTEIPLDSQPIPNFRPVAPRPVAPLEPADTIPPFVPASGPSGLHQRLKAVVEAGQQES